MASEVKNLARQAGNVADKIAQEIDALQVASNEVVTGLKTIGMSINTVLEYATATASAIEEQSIVTQETSTGIQNTAGGTQNAAQVLV